MSAMLLLSFFAPFFFFLPALGHWSTSFGLFDYATDSWIYVTSPYFVLLGVQTAPFLSAIHWPQILSSVLRRRVLC
jgi:hypothetical protein